MDGDARAHTPPREAPSGESVGSASVSISPTREHEKHGSFLFAGTPMATAQPHTAVLSFDNTKAGLQTVDKAQTEAILQEISQGSPYYENERRKAAQREEVVRKLLEKNRLFEASVLSNPSLYRPLQSRVDAMEREIESTHRRWGFVFVHMDMDMFYAAVEQKKNPRLKDVPFGVGDIAMLSTTNYVARQYGVRSGMAGFVGKKLCPELLIVPTDFATYRAEAHVVRDVVRAYDPDFHSMGWDELTMELSEYLSEHFPSELTLEKKLEAAESVMQEVRKRVTDATQLTASAGIAPNALLAKLASNYNKPNGQHCLKLTSREDVMAFVGKLKVREMAGIGKATEAILAGLGISTIGDVYAQRYRLAYLLTEKTFQFLLAASLGLGGYLDDSYFAAKERRHNPPDPFDAGRQSIGSERTFGVLKNRAALQAIAQDNLSRVHAEMVELGLLASQVVLKLKHRSFHVKQYTKSLPHPTADLAVLRRAVDELLLPLVDTYSEYRLLGVRCTKLVTVAEWERQTQKQRQGTLNRFFSRGGNERLGDDDRAGAKRARRAYSLSSSSLSGECVDVSDGDDDDGEKEVEVVVYEDRTHIPVAAPTDASSENPEALARNVKSVELIACSETDELVATAPRPCASASSEDSVVIVDD